MIYGYIYLITNTINGRKYVGQSLDADKRWRDHKQSGRVGGFGRNKSNPLYIDMYKIGIDVFEHAVVDVVMGTGNDSTDQCRLDEKEIVFSELYQAFIDVGGYCRRIGHGKGRTSEETKKRISLSNRGKRGPMRIKRGPMSEFMKKNLSDKLKGRKLSAEHIAKRDAARIGVPLSEAHKKKLSEAKKGKIFTPEHRAKLSQAKLGKKRGPRRKKSTDSPIQTNRDNEGER